jgi:predicted RNase H-like HicB family nuclease
LSTLDIGGKCKNAYMLDRYASSKIGAKSRNGRKHRYTVYFEPQLDGTYNVVFRDIPDIVTFGRTLEEARRMAADALRCHWEGLIKDGVELPA